jgi:hypothetical protein
MKAACLQKITVALEENVCRVVKWKNGDPAPSFGDECVFFLQAKEVQPDQPTGAGPFVMGRGTFTSEELGQAFGRDASLLAFYPGVASHIALSHIIRLTALVKSVDQ